MSSKNMNQESHIGLVSKIGASHAINKGGEKAQDKLFRLNSDDLYLNDTLKFVIDYFNKYPKCDGSGHVKESMKMVKN